MQNLNSIQVTRCVRPSPIVANVEIHGFCDASLHAYCANLYLVTTDQTGTINSHLLCAKTRVAPIKERPICHLELCAAQLLSRLLMKIIPPYHCKLMKCICTLIPRQCVRG